MFPTLPICCIGNVMRKKMASYAMGRAVNSFIDQGEFVAMKTLSGRKAPRCDKHSFHDKMMAST